MSENNRRLDEHLKYLKLPFIREHYQPLAAQAAEKQLAHIDYLEKLADGEAGLAAATEHHPTTHPERRASRHQDPGSVSTGAGLKN